ncbi:MAG: CDP-4-keto-6-deoxy-D-glucose-3-dehydrase [SAR202 cluster bacterium]|nr:CDP-4-keto-6-deoxy-D-glucose-3-dehydrase [Gemmatimonadota bacterium]MQF95842.1 CDP-4-keto-6-deoxy-D-glucose-3-dehydrase [SAR202 cluster bacterium]
MRNNIDKEDLQAVIDLLQQDDPMLTQSSNVSAFESEWSQWLGCKYSVFVNSGSSANLLTMAALKETRGPGEIIVPTLTWISDIASVIQTGFKPVFVDIDPQTLGMNIDQVLARITPDTKAVFLTHVLGYNAISQKLLDTLQEKDIPLIEDVCESHGATFQGRKLGTFGLMSNFSFYYAHHMSTVEGGIVSTDDPDLYQVVRMLRSHGMVREVTSDEIKKEYFQRHPDLNPDFIFAFPAYNVRSTEINAVMGRSQLKRLNANNEIRSENLKLFLDNLDSNKYRTDFAVDGSCNYALTLVIKEGEEGISGLVTEALREHRVEFRRGTAGGGNQLRQPYLQDYARQENLEDFAEVDHVHFYGYYIGNYPDLEKDKILKLCSTLNSLNK